MTGFNLPAWHKDQQKPGPCQRPELHVIVRMPVKLET